MKIKVMNEKYIPEYKTEGSAGADLRARTGDEGITIMPYKTAVVPSGVFMEVPEGYEVQIRPRSGIAAKFGIDVILGTIDGDYRGEVGIIMYNTSSIPFRVNDGDRVAQMVVAPVRHETFEFVDNLSDTSRGASGFGSTGIK